MCRIAAVVVIIATFGLDGNLNARPHAAGAPAADGVAQAVPTGTDGHARRRVRRRRRAASRVSHRTAPPHVSPASQPAHMAPQLEDIPPVKPKKKKTPPPADIRNP